MGLMRSLNPHSSTETNVLPAPTDFEDSLTLWTSLKNATTPRAVVHWVDNKKDLSRSLFVHPEALPPPQGGPAECFSTWYSNHASASQLIGMGQVFFQSFRAQSVLHCQYCFAAGA